MTAKLEAINQILELASLPPVSDINSSTNRNIAMIENHLERAKKRTFSSYFITFGRFVTLEPNANNKIPVDQYLIVRTKLASSSSATKTIHYHPHAGGFVNSSRILTVRDGFLWNIEKDDFHDEPTDAFVVPDALFDSIASFNWREYIAYDAALRFLAQFKESNEFISIANQFRNEALKRAEKETTITKAEAFNHSHALAFYHRLE